MAKRPRNAAPARPDAAGSKGRSTRAAREAFDRLLAARTVRVERHHGALQVALALAASTARVRVDTTAEPFESTPADLFDRAFDDPRVGLTAEGMARFKANLKAQLPGIATDVSAVPEHPSLRVGDVARFVALALRASPPTVREARPRGPTIGSSGGLQQARTRVRDRFGSHFAAKASDGVVMLIGREPIVLRERPLLLTRSALLMRGAAVPPQHGGLILELTSAAPARTISRQSPRRDKVLRDAARLVDRETPDRRVGIPQVLRQTRVATARDAFFKAAGPIYAELCRRTAPDRESAGARRVEVCWLNECIRTAMAPGAVAEVAADGQIEQIDLPRRVLREMQLCGPLVGAPVFRSRTSKDGAGIVIAVIDGEVDVNHPALAGRVMHKRNLSREPFGFPDEHGTGVAGIIAANDARFAGIAPGAAILNYKIFSTDPSLESDDFDAAGGIEQALEDGAHIANCSWGAGLARDGTSRVAKACDRAWNFGMVIVKSAGNDGPRAGTLTTPADAEGVIVVGATDRRGRAVQSYSSRGPAGARSRPHLVAPGGSDTSGIETCRPGGRFGSIGSGTSFAAPHVSGLAALLLDDKPDLSPDAVRDALLQSCTRFTTGDENTQGSGLVKVT